MTVLGPIPASRLGRTMTHEHCVIDVATWFSEPVEASRKRDVNRPVEMSMLADLRRRPFSTSRDNLILSDENLTIDELNRYKRAGGQSIVDVTNVGLGRDPLALQRISRATGLNIVMGTGFYVENAHPDYVREMNADQLSELIIQDVVEGVDSTGVRSGVIGEIGLTGIPKGAGRKKVGAITAEEEKVLRAAARASNATGLAVSVHLDPIQPRAALDACDILEDEGVDPKKTIIGHMDQVQDLEYHLATAARGVFVEYDSFGREHYTDEWGYDFDWGHDSWRVRFLARMIEEGHGSQMLVSQDVCLKMDLRTYGGNGYAHFLNNMVPTLRAIDVPAEAIEMILVDNPARALAYDPAKSASKVAVGGSSRPSRSHRDEGRS
jgi:phosphotriesterase-related protein